MWQRAKDFIYNILLYAFATSVKMTKLLISCDFGEDTSRQASVSTLGPGDGKYGIVIRL